MVILFLIFLVGILLYAVLSWRTLQNVKISGKTYEEIIRNKDLVADILPPPSYIIESYLTAYKLYGEIRDTMLVKAYNPAMEFYDVAEKSYIPAINSGDYAKAGELLLGELETSYQEHRKNIDAVVSMSNAESLQIETATKALLKRTVTNMLYFLVAVLIRSVKNETESLDSISEKLSESMTETSSALEEITATIENIRKQSDKESSDVTESSASIEKIVGNIRSVSGIVQKNFVSMKDLSQASNRGKQGIDRINPYIAAQTSLLSMNAAIEAAHA